MPPDAFAKEWQSQGEATTAVSSVSTIRRDHEIDRTAPSETFPDEELSLRYPTQREGLMASAIAHKRMERKYVKAQNWPPIVFQSKMSSNKQFTLYGEVWAPNPMKVAMVLDELGLEYDIVPVDLIANEHKGPEYTKINPNGRIPALVDHSNGDFTIWESNAILLYIAERYDKEHKLTVEDSNEKYKLIQWLFFQASGQGPYYGQAFWFIRYHPERVPSAIERYQKEILRVFSVLDSVLAKQEWLVGNKLTIADLSFISWNAGALAFALRGLEGVNVEEQYPSFYKWHQKLSARPVVASLLGRQVKYVLEAQAEVEAAATAAAAAK